MASGTIQTLFTDQECTEALFPVTKTKAVIDDDNVTLDDLLRSKVSTSTTINGLPLTSDVNIGASQIKSISFEAKQTFNDEQKKIIYHNVGMVQSDWSENDPNSYAYIKNRTHWCETSNEVVSNEIFVTEREFYIANGYVHTTERYSLIPKHTYKFYFPSEQASITLDYEDLPKQVTINGTYHVIIGTSQTYLYGIGAEPTHPDIAELTPLSMNIFEVITTSKIYHPLDIKYLPIPEENVNIEYPAMEKYQGKQVYVKTVEFGDLPDGTRSIEFSSDNVTAIRISAYVVRDDGSSYTLPYIDPNTGASSILSGNFKAIFAYAENNNMTIRSTISESSTVYATIWYVKN